MDEVLSFKDRLDIAIQIGESQYREFKSCYEGRPGYKTPRNVNDVKTDIAKTLVAFCNAEGGELFIGVEDDGSISGVPYREELIQALLDSVNTNIHPETPLPSPKKGRIYHGSNLILYFSVQKGSEFIYLTSDGRCLRRKETDSIPVSCESIQSFRNESISREWEREICHGAKITDLDLDLVKNVSGQIAYGVSVEKCIQYLNLGEFGLEGLQLKRAALLLFAKEIRKWHPGCNVRILIINGKEKRSGAAYNVKDEYIEGNIFQLIDKAWERLKILLIKSTQLTGDSRFEHAYLYPETACREALINAIVHRNYAIEGRGIEIEIYTDRLEIKSPGMLLSTVKIDDIRARKGVHESRNALIARVLRETGFVREMGEGIRRIFDVMRSNALAEPEFINERDGFSVILYHRSMYDPKVNLWLSEYERFKLTENEMAVLALGYGGILFSTQDIINRLGIIDTNNVREILTSLLKKGLIKRVKTRNQAYTEAKKLRIPKREVKSFAVIDIKELLHSYDCNKENKESNDDVPFEEIDEGLQDELPKNNIRIFITNLNFDTSRETLYEFLSSQFEVLSLDLPSDSYFGRTNRGYAFATFSYAGNEEDFISQNMHKLFLDGRKLYLKRQN